MIRLLSPLKKVVKYGRRKLWNNWYKHFDNNPFNVDLSQRSRQTFLELAQGAKQQTNPEFIDSIAQTFGTLPPKDFIDDLALTTQVVIKKSKLLYLHGYLLYAALTKYLETHPSDESVTILETGTARGFSALCMAKALDDAGRAGKIITIDVLHAEKSIYWNCINDFDGKQTRIELLAPWHELVEKYLVFLRGSTDIVLNQLGLAHINFAFLDSGHDYHTLRNEIQYVTTHQKTGDVIICDDYTPHQFPGVVQAVDELLASGHYTGHLFKAVENRGYMYCECVM